MVSTSTPPSKNIGWVALQWHDNSIGRKHFLPGYGSVVKRRGEEIYYIFFTYSSTISLVQVMSNCLLSVVVRLVYFFSLNIPLLLSWKLFVNGFWIACVFLLKLSDWLNANVALCVVRCSTKISLAWGKVLMLAWILIGNCTIIL